MHKSVASSLSYQASVTIEPNWYQILRWYFPEELKTDVDVRDFVSKLTKRFKLDDDESLYGKAFAFDEFSDAISGLSLTWSRNLKQLVGDLEMVGYLLTGSEGLRDELYEKANADSERGLLLSLKPNSVAVIGGYSEISLGRIPYHDIVNFLLRVQTQAGCADYQIKKFPQLLQEIFDRDGVTYAPHLDTHMGDLDPVEELIDSEWLASVGAEVYRQRVERHRFETPMYAVSFSLKFFNPGIRPWNEIDEFVWDR